MKLDGTSRLAFLGLGAMGSRQAARLIRCGLNLTAWNRSKEKAVVLTSLGAAVADDPRAAVSAADVVFIMLENGQAVEALFDAHDLASAFVPGAIVVDMSSLEPERARKLSARLQRYDVAYLDAPVSGGTTAAEDGALAIMVGGDKTSYARVEPILRHMGRPNFLGASGAGQIAKLANQIIVGGTIAAVAEAFALARASGIDPALVRDAIRGGFAESRILELHGDRMIRRDFLPRAKASIQIKDLKNARNEARAAGMASPITDCVLELFNILITSKGDLDHSALIEAYSQPGVSAP